MLNFNVTILKSKVHLNGERLIRKISWEGFRKIYVNKNYILKLESSEDFYNQCRDEYRLWKRILKKDRMFFVPVLKYFHSKEYDYIIQPRLSLRFYDKNRTPDKIWKTGIGKIVKKYKLYDLDDDTFRNWAIYNGQPIIFDYGV